MCDGCACPLVKPLYIYYLPHYRCQREIATKLFTDAFSIQFFNLSSESAVAANELLTKIRI